MKTPTIRAALLLSTLAACSRDEARAPETASGASSTGVGLATVTTKPEMLPPDKRRVIELEGGVRVEVLAEGQGSIVAPGDEVALSMTLSYVPLPPKPEVEAPKEEVKDDAKPAPSKSKSKDAAEEKPAASSAESEKKDAATDAKPVEIAGDAAATAPDASSDAKAETKVDEVAKSEVAVPTTEQPVVDSTTGTEDTAAASGGAQESTPAAGAESATKTAPPPTAEEAPIDEVGTAPAPAPLAAPLDPVIVLSTKSSGTPVRGRVGSEGGLIPGLSRALVGLRAGTVAEITLPPEAAYGVDGLPAAGIPAGTSLTARIEIREVRR